MTSVDGLERPIIVSSRRKSEWFPPIVQVDFHTSDVMRGWISTANDLQCRFLRRRFLLWFLDDREPYCFDRWSILKKTFIGTDDLRIVQICHVIDLPSAAWIDSQEKEMQCAACVCILQVRSLFNAVSDIFSLSSVELNRMSECDSFQPVKVEKKHKIHWRLEKPTELRKKAIFTAADCWSTSSIRLSTQRG